MRERYVRPPIVGVEPRSARAAAWRFRIVLLLLMLALAAGVAYVVHLVVGASGNPQALGGF